MLNCEICNIEFTPINKIQKYCSKKCRIKRNNSQYNGESKKCEHCNLDFNPNKKEQKYCSKKCSSDVLNKDPNLCRERGIKSNVIQIPTNGIFLKNSIRICEWCKKDYTPKSQKQKLCSRECSNSFINKDKEVNFLRSQKGGNNSMLTLNRRGKAEIYFSELCIEYFSKPAITCNEQFFIDKNGGKWDADIIIHHLKIAILYNGIFHYKKVYKDQKLERMIAKDRLKEKIIIDNGYTYYIVKDMGKFNKEFVQEQFNLFIHKLHFKSTLEKLL